MAKVVSAVVGALAGAALVGAPGVVGDGDDAKANAALGLEGRLWAAFGGGRELRHRCEAGRWAPAQAPEKERSWLLISFAAPSSGVGTPFNELDVV